MGFKKIIASIIAHSPAPMLVRRANRRKLSILMFHGFASGEQQAFEKMEHKHLDVKKWRTFAHWLSSNHRVLPLGEAISFLEQGKSLPDHAMCLTIDDGFRSTHDLAFPILQELQLPASIYLATAFVDEKKPIWVDRVSYCLAKAGKSHAELRAAKNALKNRNQDNIEAAVSELENQSGFAMPSRVDAPLLPDTQRSLDWDQITKMRDSGLVEFGSHTHTHRILGRCSSEVILHELRKSRSIIEEHLGGNCDLFCYPNGTPGDFTNLTEAIVRETGHRASLTTKPGWNAYNASPFALRRLGVDNSLDLTRLKLMVTGVMARWEGYRSI